MSITAAKAKQLCTTAEYELFKASSPSAATKLTPARLRQKIDRARKLRDKYRDLARQQRGEARGKRKPTGTRASKGNERTVEKAQLFAEVLERFQAASDVTTPQASRAKASADTKKNSNSKKSVKKKSSASRDSSKKAGKRKKASTSKASASRKKSSSGGATAAKPAEPAEASSGRRKSTSKKEKKTGRAEKTEAKRVKTASAGGSGPLPLAGGVRPASPSLGGSSGRASGTSFSELVGAQGKSNIKGRATRRKAASESSRSGRIESQFARTMAEKIQGHVSGQTRRNQARRDSKQA